MLELNCSVVRYDFVKSSVVLVKYRAGYFAHLSRKKVVREALPPRKSLRLQNIDVDVPESEVCDCWPFHNFKFVDLAPRW